MTLDIQFVMADKTSRVSGVGVKPVPMKLFATWEVEKTSPNCIPRLCSLTLTKLLILKPLETEMQSVILAVKMHNSKRVLRSNEININPSGLLETELDLSFSLQYPHFLKRDGNKLQVMLQRRKKYKNRTILGYKTLAMGQVNMAQVLQRSVDKELSLYSDVKESADLVAKVVMLSLSSQPVDHDDRPRKKRNAADRSPEGESDDDEAVDEADSSSNEDMSDSDPINADEETSTRAKRFSQGPLRPNMGRQQRNIKQKFIALLRRLKLTDEVLDSEQDQDEVGEQNPQDIEDLFNELENLSDDSDPEIDTISVLSTPKPKLRPFFSNRGSTDVLDQGVQKVPSPPTAKVKPSVTANDSAKNSDEGSSKKPESDTNLDWSDSDSASYDATQPLPFSCLGSSQPPTPSHSVGIPQFSSRNAMSQPATPIHIHGSPNLLHSHQAPPLYTHQLSASSQLSQSFSGSSRDHQHNITPPKTPPIKHQTKVANKTTTTLLKEWRSSSRSSSHSRALVKQNSIEKNEEPRKAFMEQLGQVLPPDDSLPESLILISTQEWQGQLLSESLRANHQCVISTCSASDVRAAVSCVVTRIQKFCNTNSRAPAALKLVVVGGDSYVNSVLVPYVEQFSSKSPDWSHYIKFLVVPTGSSSVGKYLAQMDAKYHSLFNDSAWKDAFDKCLDSASHVDMAEMAQRVTHYMNYAETLLQIPIAEAMLTYHKEHRALEDESSQVFVPFLSEARVGPPDLLAGISSSLDMEESSVPNSASLSSHMSSSPPKSQLTASAQSAGKQQGSQGPGFQQGKQQSSASIGSSSQAGASNQQTVEKVRSDNHTPPNSPSINNTPVSTPGHSSVTAPPLMSVVLPECLELQVDYWTVAKPDGTDRLERLVKKDSKSSLKSPFRSLCVYRFAQSGQNRDGAGLFMVMVTKEKKQKIMKFGKKSKESESRSQSIEGMQRLICTSKSQNQPITVTIDGVDWNGVKFFQISSQWQTHIKSFPVLLFGEERYSSDTGL